MYSDATLILLQNSLLGNHRFGDTISMKLLLDLVVLIFFFLLELFSVHLYNSDQNI